jgi:signal peptidase II
MPENTPSRRGALTWFGLATAIGGGVDLWTKEIAVDALKVLPGASQWVIEPWLEWSLSYNRGTAFSLVRDLGAARWFFGVMALLVVFMLFWMVLRGSGDKLEALALGMLAGGAIGNGVDRVFRELANGGTGVVDFIKVNYPWGGSWPTFNIADALLVVGVALLIIKWLQVARATPTQPDVLPVPPK